MKQKEGKAKFCPLRMPELRRLQLSIGNRASVVLDFPQKELGLFLFFLPK